MATKGKPAETPIANWPKVDLGALMGRVAKDVVTGMTGVIAYYSVWLNGCVRIGLQPQRTDKDGNPVDMAHFDIQQIVVLEGVASPVQHVLDMQKAEPKTPGGPARERTRRFAPAWGR